MTAAEWDRQWRRLEQYRVSGDAEREQVSAEWFVQLRHWHIDAVEHGITQLIGSTKDTFLPGLGLLKDFIQSRIGKYDRSHGKCATCNGSTWIDLPPFKSNGFVYASTVTRCPDCGVPAPKMDERSRREPLTDLQAHEYAAGRYGREQMPAGCEGKPWSEGAREAHKAAMLKAFDHLRRRLFGEDAA